MLCCVLCGVFAHKQRHVHAVSEVVRAHFVFSEQFLLLNDSIEAARIDRFLNARSGVSV